MKQASLSLDSDRNVLILLLTRDELTKKFPWSALKWGKESTSPPPFLKGTNLRKKGIFLLHFGVNWNLELKSSPSVRNKLKCHIKGLKNFDLSTIYIQNIYMYDVYCIHTKGIIGNVFTKPRWVQWSVCIEVWRLLL